MFEAHPAIKPTEAELQARLDAIKAYCLRCLNPGVNTGAFSFAQHVLKLAEGQK